MKNSNKINFLGLFIENKTYVKFIMQKDSNNVN